jgi:hypothetical protein
VANGRKKAQKAQKQNKGMCAPFAFVATRSTGIWRLSRKTWRLSSHVVALLQRGYGLSCRLRTRQSLAK